MRTAATLLLSLLAACALPGTKGPASGESIAARLAGTRRLEGFLEVQVDEKDQRAFLVLPRAASGAVLLECLYTEGLSTGLGSNPVGLDRGQPGATVLLRLRRRGKSVRFEVPQLDARASGGMEEGKAVRESFAQGLLAVLPIEAEDEQRLLVDLTPFLLRDAHGVAAALRRSKQGAFRLDEKRSTLLAEACLGFPDNTELEAELVFSGEDPGPEVRASAATPETLVLGQHHSFVRLPDGGYERLAFDPRSGCFSVSYADYSAPLGEPITVRLATRHRLTGPSKGLVYHLDPAVPEPIRGALLDGARWWGEAFAAAGYPHSFRVEMLPDGVHPLDARFNVIQWVHRKTRGWSYGHSIIDPRTGEILKGHVSLGSLRVRQDIMLFEGLLGQAGGPARGLALARLRQLAAHEVGHTLGLAHNFAGSSVDRASVMDYPAPRVLLTADGSIDLLDAYGVGLGAWDIEAVRWLYGSQADREEVRAKSALPWATDQDARAADTFLPGASLWDDGPDPVRGLELALAVRARALATFGPAVLAKGRPLADLVEVFAPLFLFHRYAVEAAGKCVGGREYRHEVLGETLQGVVPVAAEVQRRALGILTGCLTREVISVPEQLLPLLVPPAAGIDPGGERLATRSGGFDPVAAAEGAVALVLDTLLAPQRCERLLEQAAQAPALPGLEEVLAEIEACLPGGDDPVARAARSALSSRLQDLATKAAGSAALREASEGALVRLMATAARSGDEALVRGINRFLTRPAHESQPAEDLSIPPGPPIGAARGCGVSYDSSWN